LELSFTYTDLYQLRMGEAYFLKNKHHEPACFEYFYRKIPFQGGYAVFCGLEPFLEELQKMIFSPSDLVYLERQGFGLPFLRYLENFRFHGTIFSVMEGDLIFPRCPAMRVEGGLFEGQLVETILLNMINYQSLVATKASRIKQASTDSRFSEFGLRRAPGLGGLLASRAAIVGGFDSTSNVLAAKQYGLSISGTMSHAFVQSFESEIDSFRSYSQINPQHCTFLVDTFDTIDSGIPNAILIAKEMEEKGQRAFGVRIDSGDLLSLSNKARNLLDASGLSYMKVIVSDNLDEYKINELSNRNAPIDIYGVGSSLVSGKPDGALDGVYKISEINDTALMKISNSREKSTLPGKKQVYRFMDIEQATWSHDYICLQEEHPEGNKGSNQLTVFPQLQKMFESGRKLHPPKSVSEIADFTKRQLKMLPERHKRIICPDPYPVITSPQLYTLEEKLASKT